MNGTPIHRRSILRATVGTVAALVYAGADRIPSAHASSVTADNASRGSTTTGSSAATIPGVRAATRQLPQFLASDPALVDALAFGSISGGEPPVRARIRLFGDMHFGFTSPSRWEALESDMSGLHHPDALLCTGDEVHFGKATEYAAASEWLAQWNAPFYSVTGNHTFWNATVRHQENGDILYARWLDQWGLPMPYTWSMAGVRFVGVGPTIPGSTSTEASLALEQVSELESLLALDSDVPTVVVMHSPLYHTVLGDNAVLHTCYTSDDVGFFQHWSGAIQSVLAAASQVVLVITGHTHSPLHAQGLLAMMPADETVLPIFNAMAIPFVRRLTVLGPYGPQDLVTWEIGITDQSLVIVGRDHFQRRDSAVATIPLGSRLPLLPPETSLKTATVTT